MAVVVAFPSASVRFDSLRRRRRRPITTTPFSGFLGAACKRLVSTRTKVYAAAMSDGASVSTTARPEVPTTRTNPFKLYFQMKLSPWLQLVKQNLVTINGIVLILTITLLMQ
ncbi:hypothetical protein BHE74_00041051 [Ensete ventricosum]|nr:hypothetical protein BHE74_00041051 [Ensete ventricosum]